MSAPAVTMLLRKPFVPAAILAAETFAAREQSHRVQSLRL